MVHGNKFVDNGLFQTTYRTFYIFAYTCQITLTVSNTSTSQPFCHQLSFAELHLIVLLIVWHLEFFLQLWHSVWYNRNLGMLPLQAHKICIHRILLVFQPFFYHLVSLSMVFEDAQSNIPFIIGEGCQQITPHLF